MPEFTLQYPMKKRHKALVALFAVLLGIPLIMWMLWSFSSSRPMALFIMDKTSHTKEQISNRSIHWFLKHYRFVKPNGRHYDASLDYYGFFPQVGNRFSTSDLSRFSLFDIQRHTLQYQAAYYVDVYGVREDDGFVAQGTTTKKGHLYGGLSRQDLHFLEAMQRMDRLVIAEFSFLGEPTPRLLRLEAEKLFGIKWRGWIGRYFHTLEKNHPDEILPDWVPAVYESQNRIPWEFTSAGIVLVHENGQLVVLAEDIHLNSPLPVITTSSDISKQYAVNDRLDYPGWFEITFPDIPEIEILSWFELDVSPFGEELLRTNDIPARFPAVMGNTSTGRMFYFSADFSQNPISTRFVRFRGAKFLELFLADLNDPTDKTGFFLTYYFPLLRTIFRNYHKELSSSE